MHLAQVLHDLLADGGLARGGAARYPDEEGRPPCPLQLVPGHGGAVTVVTLLLHEYPQTGQLQLCYAMGRVCTSEI